jgi:hypothetical protein
LSCSDTWRTFRLVISFTLALFLSGYAIQQRTLRDLRATIRPAERPRHHDTLPSDWEHLPDEFLQSNGADEYTVPDEGYHLRKSKATSSNLRAYQDAGRSKSPGGQVVIRVTESGAGVEQRQSRVDDLGNSDGGRIDGVLGIRKSEKGDAEAALPSAAKGTSTDAGGEKHIAGQSAGSTAKGEAATEKPLSRYERRKAIREEIRRLSYNPKPMYYQRRLW